LDFEFRKIQFKQTFLRGELLRTCHLKINKISLVILLVVDPLLLLFSYYIFAGLGNYPIVNILVGYIICVLLIGIPVVFIARLSARKVELDSGYNLPVFLSFLIFFANILAAALVGIIASKIKPLPEDALALRASGAIAIKYEYYRSFAFYIF